MPCINVLPSLRFGRITNSAAGRQEGEMTQQPCRRADYDVDDGCDEERDAQEAHGCECLQPVGGRVGGWRSRLRLEVGREG